MSAITRLSRDIEKLTHVADVRKKCLKRLLRRTEIRYSRGLNSSLRTKRPFTIQANSKLTEITHKSKFYTSWSFQR